MATKRILIGEKVDEQVYPRIDGNGITYDLYSDIVMTTLDNAHQQTDLSIRKRIEKTYVLCRHGDMLHENREFGFFQKQAHEQLSSQAYYKIIKGGREYYAVRQYLTKTTIPSDVCYAYMTKNDEGFTDPDSIENLYDEYETMRLVKVTRTVVFKDEEGNGHTFDDDDNVANHRNASLLIDGVFHMTQERYENQFANADPDADIRKIIADDLGFVSEHTEVRTTAEPSSVLMRDGEFLNVRKLDTVDVWVWGNRLCMSSAFDPISRIAYPVQASDLPYILLKPCVTRKLPSEFYANSAVAMLDDGNIVKIGATDGQWIVASKKMTLGSESPTFTSPTQGSDYGYIRQDWESLIRPVTMYERPLRILETDAQDIDGNIGRVNSIIAKASNLYYTDHTDIGFYVANDRRYWRVTGNVVVDFQESTGEESHDQMKCGSFRVSGTKMNDGVNNPYLFSGSMSSSDRRTSNDARMTEGMPSEPFGRIKKKDTGYVEYTPVFGDKETTPDLSIQDMGGTMRVFGDVANMPLTLTDKDINGIFESTQRDYTSKSMYGMEDEPYMNGRTCIMDTGYVEYTPVFADKTDEITEQLLCGTIRKHGNYGNHEVTPDMLVCMQCMATDVFEKDTHINGSEYDCVVMDDMVYEAFHGTMDVHDPWDYSSIPLFPHRETEQNTAQMLCGTISKKDDGYGNRYVGIEGSLVCLN